MVEAARIGRQTANGPEAALAQHAWQASDQPAWLTPELFSQRIQPLLASIPMSDIRKALGVSNWYASKIRQGYRPHLRHWLALVGVSSPL